MTRYHALSLAYRLASFHMFIEGLKDVLQTQAIDMLAARSLQELLALFHFDVES